MTSNPDREKIAGLLEKIRQTPNCSVIPGAGRPSTRMGHQLPDDLEAFFDLCGGVALYASATFSCRIVGGDEFAPANVQILGEEAPDDRSDSWYLIAKGTSSEAISIDLCPDRLGRCYDSFWDRHGVVGSCPIVARSFHDLLSQLFENKGNHWYWLEPGFASLGDAYD